MTEHWGEEINKYKYCLTTKILEPDATHRQRKLMLAITPFDKEKNEMRKDLAVEWKSADDGILMPVLRDLLAKYCVIHLQDAVDNRVTVDSVLRLDYETKRDTLVAYMEKAYDDFVGSLRQSEALSDKQKAYLSKIPKTCGCGETLKLSIKDGVRVFCPTSEDHFFVDLTSIR